MNKEKKMNNISVIERFDVSNYIKGKLDWFPIEELRGPNTRRSKSITDVNGRAGIYQIAHINDVSDIGESVFHPKIGYTGKSENIFGRLGQLKNNSHTTSPYIRNNFKTEDIRVRIFFTGEVPVGQVEAHFHDHAEREYGYRFAWREASGGIDGILLRIQDHIDNIDSLDALKELSSYIDERAVEIFKSTWKQDE